MQASRFTVAIVWHSEPIDFVIDVPQGRRIRAAGVDLCDAGKLGRIVARNLTSALGILSLSGVRATARCQDGRLAVRLFRPDGRELPASTPLLAVTNGYLASGGDGLLEGIAGGGEESRVTLRDALASVLTARGGELSPGAHPPRLEYPGPRPVQCR